MEELVHLEVDRGVAHITLDSPTNRNALSAQLVDELHDRASTSSGDPDIRAIVLSGTGPVFCSGADLKASPDAPPSRYGVDDILLLILGAPKPVVVKLNGHARAGGIGLVAAADIVIAPDDATFAFAEVRIGVVPAIISVVCRRVLTARAAQRLLLTGVPFSAAEAAQAGLVTTTCPRAELDRATTEVLDAIRQAEPSAVARTKRLLAELRGMDLTAALPFAAEVSAQYFRSEEAVEGIRAFREKRLPSWAGGGSPLR